MDVVDEILMSVSRKHPEYCGDPMGVREELPREERI